MSTLPRVRLAVMVAVIGALVVAASIVISGDDEDVLPAEVAGPTPQPTVSPLPPLQLERIPVRWTEVPDVLEFGAAAEQPEPFANFFTEDSPLWQFMIAQLDGGQHELLTTGRWLREVTWDEGGIELRFLTKRDVPSLFGTVTALWFGTMNVDPGTRTATTAFDSVPISGCTMCERRGPLGSTGPGVTIYPSPAGDRVLLALLGSNPPLLELFPFPLQEAYLVDASGRSRRLEGLSQVWAVGWFPTGRTLTGSGGRAMVGRSDRYLLPDEDGEGIVLRESLGLASRGEGNPPYGDDPRAVFAYHDEAGPSGPGDYLGVYNTDTGEAWSLGLAPPAVQLGSGRLPEIPLMWPYGSEEVRTGFEPNMQLIDPGTGEHRPVKKEDLSPPYRPPEVKSPDGRYTAWFDDREPMLARDPSCAGLPYRLNLRDERSGTVRILMQCNTDTTGQVQWLTSTKLIARLYDCSQCEPTRHHIVLIDVTSGKQVSLTDGLEDRAEAVPSPDGKKVVVSGQTLRVYDNSGKLLEDYGAPAAGYLYDNIVWSPDSKAFAYVVIPEEFRPGI